jgi:hypothetical protein
MGFGLLSAVRSCVNASNCPLYLNSIGQYTLGPTGNTKTPYTRQIGAITTSNTNDLKIFSTVSWSDRGTSYTVTVVSHLTPWQ